MPAKHTNLTLPRKGPSRPVKVSEAPDMNKAELDESNRVVVPAGHANITLPGKAPSIPVEVPSLPDF